MVFFPAAAAFVIAIAVDEAELAVDFAEGRGGVAFVGVDVHREGKRGGNADDGVPEDGLATALSLDVDRDDVAVFDAEGFRVFRGHVDVALGDDDAFLKVDFARGTLEGAAAGTGDVAGFADGGGDAEGTGIREAQLDLVGFADRAEDREGGGRTGAVRVFLVVAKHRHLVGRSVLAGLGKHFANGEFVAFPEENLERFLRDVDVTGARFD